MDATWDATREAWYTAGWNDAWSRAGGLVQSGSQSRDATWDAWWQDGSPSWSEQAVSAYNGFWTAEVEWYHQDARRRGSEVEWWMDYDHQQAEENQSGLWWSNRKNRETQLGPSFQNFRKSMEHKLEIWQFHGRRKKRFFSLWRWQNVW